MEARLRLHHTLVFFSLFSIGGHALAVPSSVDRIIIIGG